MSAKEEVEILRRISRKHTFPRPQIDEFVYSNVPEISIGYTIWGLSGLPEMERYSSVWRFSITEMEANNLKAHEGVLNNVGKCVVRIINECNFFCGVTGELISIEERKALIDGLV